MVGTMEKLDPVEATYVHYPFQDSTPTPRPRTPSRRSALARPFGLCQRCQ